MVVLCYNLFMHMKGVVFDEKLGKRFTFHIDRQNLSVLPINKNRKADEGWIILKLFQVAKNANI